MKFELTYLDGGGEFHDFQRSLWDLQRQTREILNRTLQYEYQWEWKCEEHLKQTGKKLDILDETGLGSVRGYINRRVTDEFTDMNAKNVSSAVQTAHQKFGNTKFDVKVGKMSLPSYRSDQPIILHNENVKLYEDETGYAVKLSLFSNAYKNSHELKGDDIPVFRLKALDGTQRSIVRNIFSGTYGIGQSQLIYEKKKWFLYLTYSFVPEEHPLNPQKILGVDLGVAKAVYASSKGEHGSFIIDGDEGREQIERLEAIRRSKQRQARYCGEGRIGHGTKTRVGPAYDTRDKIARIQDTLNHRWSKALVDYAVKNRYGVIQMEDLSGIKKDSINSKYLRHWTYYDLQTKIENKAKAEGIEVRKIDPQYTSQRCSQCGYINKDNRPDQEHFHCQSCGFETNADYNASQNISIKDIAEVIEKTKNQEEQAKKKD